MCAYFPLLFFGPGPQKFFRTILARCLLLPRFMSFERGLGKAFMLRAPRRSYEAYMLLRQFFLI